MKLKGVSPFEQHVEKLVLGAVGLVFVVVVAQQLLGGGSKVTVDGKAVPIDQAFAPIEASAERLAAEVGNPSPPGLPEVKPVDLAATWAETREPTVAPVRRFAGLAPLRGPQVGALSNRPAVELTAETKYAEIAVPAPSSPRAIPVRNTVDPFFVARNKDVAQILAQQGVTEQPFDLSAVTVEAKFAGAEFARMLRADPEGEGIVPLPEALWRDLLEILAVQFERQEMTSQGWGPAVPVSLRPGETSLLTDLRQENLSPEVLLRAVDFAAGDPARIVQPRYLPVLAGDPWLEPEQFDRMASIDANRRVIDQTVRRLTDANAQVERATTRLNDLRRPTGPQGPNSPAPPTDSTQVRTAERDLERATQIRDTIVAELRGFGVDETGEPLPPEEANPEMLVGMAPMLDTESLSMWTHDFNVVSGGTYRYRARVVMNNPLFGEGARLSPDQAPIAAIPLLEGAWSEWGPAVSIEPTEVIFVTSAQLGDVGVTPAAGVEVFKFYYGYWRRGRASVSVGERIDARLRLPDPKALPIFNVGEAGAPAGSPPSGPRQPVQPPPRSGLPATEFILPPGATAGPTELTVAVDAWLLDVATIPGSGPVGGTPRNRALFRNGSGAIVAEAANDDPTNPRFQRLAKSAEVGMRQGQPEPKPEAEKPPELPPVPDPRDRDGPGRMGPPGGGGGGGGGG